ncbi:MAG: polyprenyl synthetase family protein [Treponema sp.]|nr:polyprenyl synthetase family protein [Treponema sp.]
MKFLHFPCIILLMKNDIKTEFQNRLSNIESVLKKYLPENANDAWKTESFGKLDGCITDEHMRNLIEPTGKLISLGGKRWRPLLLVLCSELVGRGKIDAYEITPLVEFAHNASLIHDDIEDCADTRRGQPAAHITFGIDTALNAGSWLYFQAATCIKNISGDEKTKNIFYELFLEELRRLHLGQAMDILWHRNPTMLPTEDEYRAMVRNKTGTLARLAVKAGVLAGGADREKADAAGKIAEDIGTGFQIIDDVINLTSGNPGKKRGDDIVEGKKSLPVIIHLSNANSENSSEKEKLAKLFEKAREEGIESSAVEEAISILEKSGSIDKARKIGNKLIEEKSKELVNLFGNADSDAAKLITGLFKMLRK